MENYEDLKDQLNDVLAKTYDAIEGYKNAVENVQSGELKSFFSERVTERMRFAAELSSEISSLGGDPVTEGSFKGSLHRTWMDIKSAVSSDNEEEIIEECIRGEKAAREEYDEILDSDLPATSHVQRIVTQHKQQLNQAVNRLQALEDKY